MLDEDWLIVHDVSLLFFKKEIHPHDMTRRKLMRHSTFIQLIVSEFARIQFM